MEFLFHFSAIIVMPFWMLMILLPGHDWTDRAVRSPWIIIPPALCYTLLLVPNLPGGLPAFFAAPGPESLSVVLQQPWAASMFWAYAGAFDLFVGRWIYFDSRERTISHWLIAPILAITVFFGPIGFLLYALLRGVSGASGRLKSAIRPGRPSSSQTSFPAKPVNLRLRAIRPKLNQIWSQNPE